MAPSKSSARQLKLQQSGLGCLFFFFFPLRGELVPARRACGLAGRNRERIPSLFLEAPDTVVFLERHRKPEPCATAVSGLPLHFLSLLASSSPLSFPFSLLHRLAACTHTHTYTHTNAIVTNLPLSPSADLDNRSFHADMHNCTAI